MEIISNFIQSKSLFLENISNNCETNSSLCQQYCFYSQNKIFLYKNYLSSPFFMLLSISIRLFLFTFCVPIYDNVHLEYCSSYKK